MRRDAAEPAGRAPITSTWCSVSAYARFPSNRLTFGVAAAAVSPFGSSSPLKSKSRDAA